MALANANIGVATAAFYPSLMLSANGGWDSNQMASLFNAPSLLWSLGAAMSQSLFDGGKNRANVAIAQSAYRASVAGYRQTILVALQEVQTGIDTASMLSEAQLQAQSAARSYTRVLALAQVRYEGGLDIYLNVIAAQQALLSSERQVAQIHAQQLANAVYLVKALGGSWSSTPPGPTRSDGMPFEAK